MLISFEFGNYYSYKEEQFFSMERDAGIKLYKSSIATKPHNTPLSCVSAIYGANASGKTGFIKALHFVYQLVTKQPAIFVPFVLDDDSKKNDAFFSILLIAKDNKKYQYDIRCGLHGIKYESLHIFNSQKPSKIYERFTKLSKTEISFGKKFTSKNIKEILKSETVIDEKTLLLSYLGNLNEEVTLPVYDFFDKGLLFSHSNTYMRNYNTVIRHRPEADEEFARVLNKVLQAADLGISGVRTISPTPLDIERLAKIDPRVKNSPDFVRNNTQLVFEHYGMKNGDFLNQNQESDGTIAMIVFTSMFYDALKDGLVCVVDEIDSSLHPILVAKMIEIFNSKETNPNGAQLIFTTHDISLIENYEDGEILDRDQIWFAEKNRLGESRLYPLTSIKEIPRQGTNIGLKYIHGRYGATPNVSIFEKLQEINFPREA